MWSIGEQVSTSCAAIMLPSSNYPVDPIENDPMLDLPRMGMVNELQGHSSYQYEEVEIPAVFAAGSNAFTGDPVVQGSSPNSNPFAN